MFFNINIYYETNDFANEIILELQKCSQIIYDKLNLILNIFEIENDETINRYKKLLDKLWDERSGYDLIDFPPEKYLLFLPSELQSLLEKNIKNKGSDENNYSRLISDYVIGIENAQNYIFKIKEKNFYYLMNQGRHVKRSLKYISEKLTNKTKIMPIIHNEDFIIQIFKSNWNDVKYSLENSIFIPIAYELKFLAINLYQIEIKMGGNLNIAILKSLVEELIFNLLAGKVECYLFLNFIVEFAKKAFGYKVKINSNFTKNRHLQINGRTLYKSIYDGVETGENNNIEESMVIIMKLIEDITTEQSLLILK